MRANNLIPLDIHRQSSYIFYKEYRQLYDKINAPISWSNLYPDELLLFFLICLLIQIDYLCLILWCLFQCCWVYVRSRIKFGFSRLIAQSNIWRCIPSFQSLRFLCSFTQVILGLFYMLLLLVELASCPLLTLLPLSIVCH